MSRGCATFLKETKNRSFCLLYSEFCLTSKMHRTLRANAAMWPRAGHWALAQQGKTLKILLSCARCGHVENVLESHKIERSGLLDSWVICKCGHKDFYCLDGWDPEIMNTPLLP